MRGGGAWEDFGYFIQNCREYLGHVDIGLPLALLDRAGDCARKLGNLDKVFEGAGVATAGRVGRVLGAWHGARASMASSETAVPRTDASYGRRRPRPRRGLVGEAAEDRGGRRNGYSFLLPCPLPEAGAERARGGSRRRVSSGSSPATPL